MNYKQAKKILDKHKDKAKYIVFAITKDTVMNVCIENELERLTKKQMNQILDVIDEDIEQASETNDLMHAVDEIIFAAMRTRGPI